MPAIRGPLLALLVCMITTLSGCSGCVPSKPPPSPTAAPPEATTESASPPAGSSAPADAETVTAAPVGDAPSEPASKPVPAAETPPKSAGGSPDGRIRGWLTSARRRQQAGQPGEAYVLAADASGLVRRVRDPQQRAALQAEIEGLLQELEPAVERSTRGAETTSDNRTLIEK